MLWLPPNAARVEGKDAVRAFALPFTEAEGFSGTWTATAVEISAGGSLAYSIRTYEYSLRDAEGNEVSNDGKNMNIWKKQPDGSWKVAVVIWNSDQPAASE